MNDAIIRVTGNRSITAHEVTGNYKHEPTRTTPPWKAGTNVHRQGALNFKAASNGREHYQNINHNLRRSLPLVPRCRTMIGTAAWNLN